MELPRCGSNGNQSRSQPEAWQVLCLASRTSIHPPTLVIPPALSPQGATDKLCLPKSEASSTVHYGLSSYLAPKESLTTSQAASPLRSEQRCFFQLLGSLETLSHVAVIYSAVAHSRANKAKTKKEDYERRRPRGRGQFSGAAQSLPLRSEAISSISPPLLFLPPLPPSIPLLHAEL